MAYDGSKCLGERFQDAFLKGWGVDRTTSYADLGGAAQIAWNRAAIIFVASLSDAPNPSLNATPGREETKP